VKTQLELHRSRQRLLAINRQLNAEIAERKKSEERYRSMVRNAVQGMFQSTLDGRITDLNPAYTRILGYDSPEEVMAIEDVGDAFYDDPNDRIVMIERLREKGFLANYELKIRKRDGSPAWIMLNSRLAADENDEPFIEGIVIEHTAQKLAEEELRRSREEFRHQAVHDNLTGLYNTRYLYQTLQKLVEISGAQSTPFSLIFMDVDDFKTVVDTYGHLKGSQTLQEMARTIQETLVAPAYGVAYGGDEFVVVLPGYDKPQAVEKAGEIRIRIRETSYLASHGHDIRIRASFGIASFPEDATDVKGLLALADQAMFDVKDGGKDAVRASHGRN
jgi:diguanylate cyclase (GGDEF)-like protein/PAS domain S-box-containing protein